MTTQITGPNNIRATGGSAGTTVRDGLVSLICQVPRCDSFQRVLLEDPLGDTLRVCHAHWKEALDRSDGEILGTSLISCPTCARPGCSNEAKASVPDFHGGDLPICAVHLGDFPGRAVTDGVRPGRVIMKSEVQALCCCAIGCDDVATIIVDVEDEPGLPFCGRHWDQVRDSGIERRVRKVPDRPNCFRSTCTAPAVSVMTHLDGTPLPVCDEHLDGLDGAERPGAARDE